MRIAVLDDNEALADVIAASLRAEGFLVVVFRSPQEALLHLRETDVLLTDYQMPGMTGLEVARKAYERGWRGALFIMSGRVSELEGKDRHPLPRVS